ncbi:MAG: LysM peptidoglycan-binding domain-containing protein [Planctomycetes bacterium]|nr:LysM peptidoglycan-binding domain-containing protein [Planctomycetota bacterium]
MSDIEKYGLFAVILVGGLLLLVAVGGGFSDTPEAPTAGAPVVLEGPAALRAPDGGARNLDTVRVSPLLPADKPFTWNEPPLAYPGERSADPAPGAPVVLQEPVASTAAGATPPATYVIRSGDTLGAIARRTLGSESRWEELVKLNPGLDPKRLKIGATIRLAGSAPATLAQPAPAPAVAAPPVVAKAAVARTHTVKSGDTLGAIAKAYLGSATKADALFEANKDLLKSPDALKVGQVLRIP